MAANPGFSFLPMLRESLRLESPFRQTRFRRSKFAFTRAALIASIVTDQNYICALTIRAAPQPCQLHVRLGVVFNAVCHDIERIRAFVIPAIRAYIIDFGHYSSFTASFTAFRSAAITCERVNSIPSSLNR